MISAAIILFLLSIGVIAFVFVRHWKEIRLLDPNSVADERARQKRETLLLTRLHRQTEVTLVPLRAFWRVMAKSSASIFQRLKERLTAIEEFYQHAKSPLASVMPSTADRLKVLLDDGRSLLRDEKYADAERRFFDVLHIDSRNIDAYKSLGLIYLKQKLYPQAIETLEFIVKSKKADDMVCAYLADTYQALDQLPKEEQFRMKALELRPRLAHRHAELAEMFLRREAPAKAQAYAEKSLELEPESLRYLETCLETAIQLKHVEKAKKYFDKYRSISDAEQKIRQWKERIDSIV